MQGVRGVVTLLDGIKRNTHTVTMAELEIFSVYPHHLQQLTISKKYWKRYSKGTYGPTKKNGNYVSAAVKNSSLQKNIMLGDIVQVWESEGKWHHSMIVTGGSKGNWKVSYHSNACGNKPLNTRGFARTAKYRIIRIK